MPLVLNPDLVLFDEPTTGLGPVAAYHLSELIVHVQEEAEKLDKYFRRITSCPVLVETPHRHHRQAPKNSFQESPTDELRLGEAECLDVQTRLRAASR